MTTARIAKRFTFDAAHRLDRLPPDHKCHRMHGHTYSVELVFDGLIDGSSGQPVGFVLDYAVIDDLWRPLHDQLDHRVLNEVSGLEIPTTEVLAHFIFDRIKRALRDRTPASGWSPRDPFLKSVRVYESSTTWCEVIG